MARTIVDQTISQQSLQTWVKIVFLGAVAGAASQLVALLISRYAIQPSVCDVANVMNCASSSVIAGNIALVIVGVAAVFVAIRMNLYRPLVVIAAATITLWGLTGLTSGLWWLEALSWTIVLFALVYALYGWIARYLTVIPMLVVSVAIAVLTRLIPLLY